MFKPTTDQMEELLRARDYLMSFRDEYITAKNDEGESETIDIALCDAIYSTDYVVNMMGERT